MFLCLIFNWDSLDQLQIFSDLRTVSGDWCRHCPSISHISLPTTQLKHHLLQATTEPVLQGDSITALSSESATYQTLMQDSQ